MIMHEMRLCGSLIFHCRRRKHDALAFDRFHGPGADAFCLYADFHAEVAKKLTAMPDQRLLIDCHSFSALPNLLVSSPPDIDICIGYNEDESFPGEEVVGRIVKHFQTRGYKVGINAPFSNSKTFSVPVKYHSVMIEVNKRLYMDEQTRQKTEDFDRLKNDIRLLYDLLLAKDCNII